MCFFWKSRFHLENLLEKFQNDFFNISLEKPRILSEKCGKIDLNRHWLDSDFETEFFHHKILLITDIVYSRKIVTALLNFRI